MFGRSLRAEKRPQQIHVENLREHCRWNRDGGHASHDPRETRQDVDTPERVCGAGDRVFDQSLRGHVEWERDDFARWE